MKQKVMVIDDSPETVTLIETWLKQSGFDVLSAFNGKEGLEKVKTNRPDLIICDILMPEMDGFAFYKELKKDEATANIPILIVTVRQKMEDTFRALGVGGFVAKPYNPTELIAKIQGCLDGMMTGAPSVSTSRKSPQSKVLVAGNAKLIVEQMRQQLSQSACLVETVLRGTDLLNKVVEFKPHIIVLDVVMDNMSSKETVSKLRKLSDFGMVKAIILYSYLDRNSVGGGSVNQRATEIDRARTACLEAGATEAIGGYEESTFLSLVGKHIQHT